MSDKQAEVAFKMAKLWKKEQEDGARAGPGEVQRETAGAAAGGSGTGLAPGLAAGGDQDMNARNSEGNSEDETDELAWEQLEEAFPEDLGHVLQRFQNIGLQVQVKEILDCCPKWSGLKTKAEANN